MDSRTIKIIALVVIVLIIILIIVYYMGKRSKQEASKVKVGSDEAGTTELTQAEIDKLRALAIAVHNDFDGWNITGWQDDLYDQMQLLSDTELVAMTNIFNVLYEQDSGQTFLQWWDGEQFYVEGVPFQQMMQDLKKRMVNLGIV